MSSPIDVDQYFSMMKTLTNIPIESEWEETIKSHLNTAAKMASIIEDMPIDENSLEFSNSFEPGR